MRINTIFDSIFYYYNESNFLHRKILETLKCINNLYLGTSYKKVNRFNYWYSSSLFSFFFIPPPLEIACYMKTYHLLVIAFICTTRVYTYIWISVLANFVVGLICFRSWRPYPMKTKILICRAIFWILCAKVSISSCDLETNFEVSKTFVWAYFWRDLQYKMKVDVIL